MATTVFTQVKGVIVCVCGGDVVVVVVVFVFTHKQGVGVPCRVALAER